MRGLIALIGAVLISFSSGTAQAYEPTDASHCSPVDFRNDISFRMRDQGDISWCYANAAADYLQYFYHVNETISAADIAIRYNLRWWPRLVQWLTGDIVPETGFIRSAMWDSIGDGYCSEKDLPSDLWTRSYVKDGLKRRERVPLKSSIRDMLTLQQLVQAGAFIDADDLPYYYEFPAISKKEFFEILATTSNQTLLNTLRLAACDRSRKPYIGEKVESISMNFRGSRAFSRINGILDHHQALTVDFFYGVMVNADDFKRSIAELHTTLLAGRRFDPYTQQCQYLIKNSHGESCEGYDPRHACEKGYLWISENLFYPGLVSYVFLRGEHHHYESIDMAMENASEETEDVPDFQSELRAPASTTP